MVTPRRGDVFWVTFDPVQGSEQGGHRPAVIVQNDVGNEFSPTTIVAAIASKAPSKPFPFVVAVPSGALPRESIVDCAHIRTVDRSRLSELPVAHLDADTMRLVDDALRSSLGLRQVS